MRRDRLVFSFYMPLVLLLALMFGMSPSWAQSAGEGILNAVSFKALPNGLSLRVVPIDNSDRNLILQRAFEHQLSNAGYTIADDATLILTFETRDRIGNFTSRKRRAFLELQAHGGREGGENAKMLFNLYDSNTGGVFNEGKGETSIVTKGQYRMDVTIDDKSNGKRLWQAWTTADLDQYDSEKLAKSMIPVLVKSVGSNVKRQTFKVH